MVKRKAIVLAPLAMAAVALPTVWIGAASATGTSNSGVVHLYQVNDKISDTVGPVTLTGAIGDYGTDVQGAGGPEINVLYFPNAQNPTASFAVDLSNFGRGHRPLSVNETNCSFTSLVSGRVPIVPNSPFDTGAYKQVSGTFQVNATFAGVVPGQPGACDFSLADNTPTGLDFIEATGNISGI
jgi:hypothetical protein